MNSPEPLRDFVPFLKNLHATQQFDILDDYWTIILYIQDNLVDLDGDVVELDDLRQWNDDFDGFARRAYDWLLLHHECGSSEAAIRHIANTRPYMERATRDLATHELSQARKPVRRAGEVIHREYRGLIRSVADFWVQDTLAQSRRTYATSAEETGDLRRSPHDQRNMVRRMIEAIKDMSEKQDGKEFQVNQIKTTSHHVFENVAWQLWVEAVKAQDGHPDVHPWATSFYRSRYASLEERWEALINLMKKSKAAAANVLLAPIVKRFANDPQGELSTKRSNANTNGNRATAMAQQKAAAQNANHNQPIAAPLAPNQQSPAP
ncbi:hypothetical protein B0T20DRAFT_391224 [Sordaria brevicollis]|uniref:Uncharacterized protein n=1 Tax=Sordaria brevicollis TaxID=83679 RepID=A0AAE0PGZ1_SORBR|nr:hypothetical protein B0T20DRAFT_391224 [Sordaria brevicollis]